MLGEIYLVGQAESCYTKQYEVFTMLEMCVSLRLTITTISQRVARFRGVNRRTGHIVTSAAMVLTLRLDELQRDTEKSKLGIISTTRRIKVLFLGSCCLALPIALACQASESATVFPLQLPSGLLLAILPQTSTPQTVLLTFD